MNDGARPFLNPWLGLRAGYTDLDDRRRFVLGAELGLELVKYRFVSLSAYARGLTSLGPEAGVVVKVPF